MARSKKPKSKQSVAPSAAPPSAAKPPAPKRSKPVESSQDGPRAFNPLEYLTQKELSQIDKQFAVTLKDVDRLLFWTGVERDHAQRWADKWRLKTLTTAMGPLMDPANSNSPKSTKSKKKYSRYIKGASGRFAQYARQHCRVIVLTNPPPDIYSTREDNTYQSLEEPILKGSFGDPPVRRIDYVHPTVHGAAHVLYQVWPNNKTHDWLIVFAKENVRKWRKLNWSYKSIITTSQLDLKLPQEQTLPINSMLGLNANDTHIKHTVPEDEDVQQAVDLIGRDYSLPTIDIRGHESRVFIEAFGQAEPAASDSRFTDTQVNDRVDQRTDSHEMKLFSELATPLAPIYAVENCRKPELPVKLPVVKIDDLPVGGEVKIDANEDDAKGDFAFLTMQTKPGTEHWWKMRWL